VLGEGRYLAVVLLKHPGSPQLDAHVEGGLSPHADQNAIRSFLGDDFFYDIGPTITSRGSPMGDII
jgi:hypothetical protein